ncbi:MAG: type II secretion system F family protein [Acidobacteria bacterium]|nr:type II secretion system F family protein [Acidobacteriota bacterium]
MDWIFPFLFFSASLLTAGYYIWQAPRERQAELLAGRLRELRVHARTARGGGGPADLLVRREQRGRLAALGDFVAWIGLLRRLQEFIDQANLKKRAADVLALSILLALGVFFVLGIVGLRLFLLRLLFAGLVGALPIANILRIRAKRLRKFEELLPDAIDLFTRTMRAGHNIHSGLETIATETINPVKMEFKKLMEELALGSQIEPALHNLGKRVPIIDLKFFITGLILQRQTGANMVGVLENLALLVRERLNMAAKMKAHTAQQRMSAGLLCALPIVVGLGFWVLKPQYIHLLYTDPLGQKLLTYGIISGIIGILVIRELANPKF